MLRRLVLAALTTMLLLAVAGQGGAGLLDTNKWLGDDRQPLNIAHQGGEIEAPSNTLYAFKTALVKGADVLEMDVHATSDRELVVLHDATVDRTTGGTGRVDSMTLGQITALDAAYWFIPDEGTVKDPNRSASDYTLRGIATGQKSPPAGYSANDFTIPRLEEVLQTFPNTLINIEIKATAPDTLPYESLLAELLREYDREDDVIVVSFLDHAVEMFKAFAPEINSATATLETAVARLTAENVLPGTPNPRYVAVQVPVNFMGVTVIDEGGDYVEDANANGFAVHVWTIDSANDMNWLLDLGVQGIMTNRPALLESVLTTRGTPTP